MIHGGVRDSIALQFRKRAAGAPEPAGLRTAAAQAFVDTNCTGAPVPYHLVAADGLTMAAAPRTQVAVLQPGYRWDALVVFPEPGDYCVLDNATTGGGNVNQNLRPTQLLGTVRVGGTAVTGDLADYLKTQLLAAAAANMPQDVRAKVTAEIADGMKLSSFIPHPDINRVHGNADPHLQHRRLADQRGVLRDRRPALRWQPDRPHPEAGRRR